MPKWKSENVPEITAKMQNQARTNEEEIFRQAMDKGIIMERAEMNPKNGGVPHSRPRHFYSSVNIEDANDCLIAKWPSQTQDEWREIARRTCRLAESIEQNLDLGLHIDAFLLEDDHPNVAKYYAQCWDDAIKKLKKLQAAKKRKHCTGTEKSNAKPWSIW